MDYLIITIGIRWLDALPFGGVLLTTSPLMNKENDLES